MPSPSAARPAGPAAVTPPAPSVSRPLSALVALASFAGGVGLLYGLRVGPSGPRLALDVAAGAACCAALFWRARAPLAVGVLTAVGASVFATAGVANIVALFAVARRRPLRLALALAALDVAAGLVFALVYPGNSTGAVTATVNIAVSAAAVAWGALVRAQRSLVRSWQERVERAEADQRLRAEQIRAAERAEIAREMHDIVAHRVSLVALHAGGLAVRPDLGPEQVRQTALLIRGSARDALDEMRRVVGALREDAPASGAAPSLGDLAGLVRESAATGAPVQLDMQVPDGAQLPAWLARTAYRVVQESVTNALRHAPGAPTRVAVRGRPGDRLTVSVRNPLVRDAVPPDGLPADGPGGAGVPAGGGAGLLGLTERVSLAGGSLRHGRDDSGQFRVEAELPWPANRGAAGPEPT